MEKKRAPRNRTLTLSDEERRTLPSRLLRAGRNFTAAELAGRIICGEAGEVLPGLPGQFVDLLILDPPYNLDKSFGGRKFSRMSVRDYQSYLDAVIAPLRRLLKPTASLYLCCDWQCSAAGFEVLSGYFKIRNRIVWQREKGRGALRNWKNCCEDIWFATVSGDYRFNLDAVKLKRRVLAPYRQDGRPKDWVETGQGRFRMTSPSNFWDDISVPYWSMPENTDHPTQKPEKLLAKLILASSDPGDMVFDPFLGSGTTAVTACKLERRFAGIELCEEYCCWALKRLDRARENPAIQGYEDGVFWERNTRCPGQKR